MGSYAAEELELALAAESAGGVQPSTPTIDMMKDDPQTQTQTPCRLPAKDTTINHELFGISKLASYLRLKK